MAFKSFAVAVGNTNTDVIECPATQEGAAVLNISNVSGGASTYTLKLYKQALGTTVTIAATVAIAANVSVKYPAPISMQAGDKLIMVAPATSTIVASGTFTYSGATPAAVGFVGKGDWSSVATYDANDYVHYTDGNAYVSIADSNTDNQPDASPAYWMVLAEKGAQGETGGLSSVNGDAGPDVVLSAADIDVAATPANYTPGDASIEGHLSGIDTALASAGGGALTPPQGRLTLTSGVAVTTGDVSGATTIYYTPAGGQNVPIYDGAAWSMKDIGGQLSLALDSNSGHTNYHQSGKNYDLFYAIVASTYYFGSGPKWDDGAVAGSNTARGTGASSTELELYNGFWVNKNSMTLRHGTGSGDTVTVPARQAVYLGTARATANGQVSDTKLTRFLFNAYNRSHRALERRDPANSWTYSTNSWRQAGANTANKVEVLDGLGAMVADVLAQSFGSNSTTTFRFVLTGIGLDSTTVNSGFSGVSGVSSAAYWSCASQYKGYPGLGYHALNWLENGGGSDTQTWYGTDNDTRTGVVGLLGWCIA